MSEKLSSGFTLTLKNNEESRLLQIFESFAKEKGHMQLFDFVLFCFSKQFITNQTPIHSILNVFQQASGEKYYLNKDRFFFAVNLLARIMYSDEIMPLDLIITRILTEQTNENEVTFPIFDEKMHLLLTEGIIQVFEKAENGLLHILMSYNSQNIINGRKTVGIQQIKAKNLGITARNFIRFCRSRELFPAIINLEDFQKCVEEVVPAKDKDAKKFFSYGFMGKFYDKEGKNSEVSVIDPIKGEPILKLADLSLIFGRIAIVSFPMIEDCIDQVSELLETKLKLISEPKIVVKYSLDIKSDSSLSDVEDHKKILEDYYHKKIIGVRKTYKESSDISSLIKIVPQIPKFEEIEKMFDDDRVPSFPPPNVIKQENPPPYVLPPIQYPLAKSTPEKDSKEAPKKEQKNNRSETPAVNVKFTPLPGRFASSSPEKPRYESFADMRRNLNGSLYPESAKQLLANPAIQPCLIREVFMPPTAPSIVSSLIESCFAYQTSSNFLAALTTLTKAKGQWLLYEKTEVLKPDIELFFEMAKAAIYESCQKDELALAQYYSSKPFSDRLGFNNPDRALIYCGLGSVLTHLNQHSLALRSYLMAKKIRERCIGGDTIETATVYNNFSFSPSIVKFFTNVHSLVFCQF